MTDFRGVISRIIAGLEENTEETRAKVYTQAADRVWRQLHEKYPDISATMLDRQLAKVARDCAAVEQSILEGKASLITSQELQEDLAQLELKLWTAQYELLESKPPSGWSAYCVDLICPPSKSQDFISNLTEIYNSTWVPRHGERKARIIWHRQCVGLVVQHIFELITSTAQSVKKSIW